MLLLAALAFAGLWFVALRPTADSGGGGGSTPANSAPATPHKAGGSLPGGVGRAVNKANQTAAQANQAGQAHQQAANQVGRQAATRSTKPASVAKPAPARKTAPATTSKPAAGPRATSGPSQVHAALAHGKVVAILFWNPKSSDDRAVRDEIAQVSNHGGRALIVVASIGQVSRYGEVTRNVQVTQSPTVLIVDRARKARLLAGYTDRAEIGQAVSDALSRR
jgi:hypothetical protein